MNPRRDLPEQPGLFDDLELDFPEQGAPEPAEPAPGEERPGDEGEEEGVGEEEPRGGRFPAAFQARVFAGLVDLGVHLALLALVVVGLLAMGIRPHTDTLPALVLVAVIFSFFYTVIPLAFWGRTPGLVAAGIEIRTEEGHPITFGQAARRWVGNLLTVAGLGLPALLALRGRSPADRLSASDAYEE